MALRPILHHPDQRHPLRTPCLNSSKYRVVPLPAEVTRDHQNIRWKGRLCDLADRVLLVQQRCNFPSDKRGCTLSAPSIPGSMDCNQDSERTRSCHFCLFVHFQRGFPNNETIRPGRPASKPRRRSRLISVARATRGTLTGTITSRSSSIHFIVISFLFFDFPALPKAQICFVGIPVRTLS